VSEQLVDQIYEAAFVPELWPGVLDRLSEVSGSAGGALLTLGDRYPPRWAASEIIAPALRAYVAGDAWKDQSRQGQIIASGYSGFSRDIDLWSEQELDRYRASDERTRHGLGWQLGSIIPMPSGEMVIYTLDRYFDDGPHDHSMRDSAESFRAHLARAGLMAARLGLEKVRTTVATLAALGLPAAVLSASGRVVATNKLIEEMTSVFTPTAHGGLAVVDPTSNALLQAAIAEHDRRDATVRSIPVPATEYRAPVVIHLLPIRGAAHDIFFEGEVLIVATTVGAHGTSPSLSVLHGLFDLSPAEARLAAALTAGDALKTVAANHGIKFSTARSYLENIFRKTGTHQQSQLVALLKSTQPLAPPSSSIDRD
jgi:DNA-binding CsgD family transcriptional regulator